MQRLRRALPVLVAIAATWGLTTAPGSAQGTIPGYVYLRDSQGQIWFTGRDGAVRGGVPIYPASDDEIAAIPSTGQWLVPKPDGSGLQPGARPDWDVTNAAAEESPAQSPASSGENAVKLGGERGENTKPFSLRGGEYTVNWSARLNRDASSCFASGALYKVEGNRYVESLFSVLLKRDGDRNASGETQVYGLTSGRYYVEINSSACSWSVEISPQ